MKRVALINDLSGFGKCSLTAGIPVISAMGMQACPLPTAVLSSQTGFRSFFYDDYTERMNEITDEWSKLGVDFQGIVSGYLGSPVQIKNVLYFLEHFQRTETIFLADPVMGDNGRCIKSFSEALLSSMKQLTRKANVITPNLTELCLLADEDYSEIVAYETTDDYLKKIQEIAQRVSERAEGEQTVITTGILRQRETGEYIGNLIVSKEHVSYHESFYTGKGFSGTGDLFAAVVIGEMVQGQSADTAVKKAIEFLQPAIEEATRENVDRNHGVNFEKYLRTLIMNG
ncbi:MAG: pyridoxamine kinase [Acetatifactor sp.]|nr:pyridoxamine kinase [Acetatifactor sp.]